MLLLHRSRLFISLLLATLPGLATSPSLAQGRSLGPFLETTRQRAETSLCFVQIADGRSFDLTKLCVPPKPKNAQGDRDSGARDSGASVRPDPDATGGSGNAGGEGDRPAGGNSSTPQCYIVDTDGSPCG